MLLSKCCHEILVMASSFILSDFVRAVSVIIDCAFLNVRIK